MKRRKHRPPTQSRRELWGVSQQEADVLDNNLQLREDTAAYLKHTELQNRSVVQFSLDEPGVVFGAGLLERAVRTLKAAGYRVILRRDGVSFDPTDDYARFISEPIKLQSPHLPALQTLQRHPRLYYAAESEDAKRNLMLVLAGLFPTDRMLILVNGLYQTRRLADELASIRDVYIPRRFGSPSNSMVVIDTLSGLDWRAYSGFGVVCLYDAPLLTSRGALQRIRNFATPMPVRIAFGPPATRLTASEELAIEATFGPLVRPPAAHQTYVTQLCLPAIRQVRYSSGFERKAVYLWGNDVRNEFIAKVAGAMASGGLQGLVQLQLPCFGPQHWGSVPLRTCIVVETAEHAKNLGWLLPDWELAPDLQRSDCGVAVTGEGNIITTLDRAAGMPLDGFTVVLADGALRHWPDELCFGSPCSDRVVIDVADAFDSRAVDDARRRRDDYVRRGWSVQTMTVTRSQYAPRASAGPRMHSN